MAQVRRTVAVSMGLAVVGGEQLIKGSLVVNRRRCGKPTCQCTRGALHTSLAIMYKDKGKSVRVHVPAEMKADARLAIAQYQELKRVMDQLSRKNLKVFVRQARAARQSR